MRLRSPAGRPGGSINLSAQHFATGGNYINFHFRGTGTRQQWKAARIQVKQRYKELLQSTLEQAEQQPSFSWAEYMMERNRAAMWRDFAVLQMDVNATWGQAMPGMNPGQQSIATMAFDTQVQIMEQWSTEWPNIDNSLLWEGMSVHPNTDTTVSDTIAKTVDNSVQFIEQAMVHQDKMYFWEGVAMAQEIFS